MSPGIWPPPRGLSYRHGFHAGNFADVHNHGVLALLLGASGLRQILRSGLLMHPATGAITMHGSRMLVVHPPRALADRLARLAPALATILGSARTGWLAPE